MHEPGHKPLEQLALAERDHHLVSHPGAQLSRAVGGARGANQPDEHHRPPREQPSADRRDPEQDEEGDGVYPPLAFRISATTAGTTSCRSPITA